MYALSDKLPQRFWDKVIVSRRTGCWLWTGYRDPGGYGRTGIGSRTDGTKRPSVLAHRLAYEAMVGPIPEGLQIDHVRARGCSSRGCVNPDHLEAVAQAENIRRGDGGIASGALNRAKTACPKGHPYDEANTIWRPQKGTMARSCRACTNARKRLKRARSA